MQIVYDDDDDDDKLVTCIENAVEVDPECPALIMYQDLFDDAIEMMFVMFIC